MKTQNYFRNTVIVLMMVLATGFTSDSKTTEKANALKTEKTEFTSEGYWIDAVVITADTKGNNEKQLASKGYWIDSVVVTYDADKAMLADKGYYIEPVVVTFCNSNLNELYASR